MDIIAFSDWRSQKISLITEFLQKLEIKPDLILYAGDDITLFNRISFFEFSEEIQDKLSLAYQEKSVISLKEKMKSILSEYDNTSRILKGYGTNQFEKIAEYSKNGLCAIAGNDDDPLQSFGITGKNTFNVHEFPYIISDKYAIIGLEGSTGEIGTLLYTEDEAEAQLNEMLKKIGERKMIILSHTPPYKILDFAIRFGKRHIGSRALRRFINDNYKQIVLVVCGHVHLQGGQEEFYHGVPIVNCASHDGEYDPGRIALIRLQGEKILTTWELLHDHVKNLMKIYLVASKRANILVEQGITSIEEFYKLPLDHELASHKSFRGSFELLQRYAESLVKETIIIKKRKDQYYKKLDWKNLYFFDAEYDAERTSVGPYGIFLLGWMDLEGNVHQLFLDNPKDEKKMMNEFVQWINDNNPCFVAYSSTSADLPHLRNTFHRLRLDPLILNDLFSDYFREFVSTQSPKRQEIFFPLRGLSLKNLSDYLRYPKTELDIHNGVMAPYEYERYLNSKKKTKKEKIKKDLLKYNEDDLKRLAFLFKSLYEKYFSSIS